MKLEQQESLNKLKYVHTMFRSGFFEYFGLHSATDPRLPEDTYTASIQHAL